MTAPNFLDYLIGFDREFVGSHGTEANYPPFDVYRDGENTILEFALAGHSKDNIEVVVENSILKVSAHRERKTEEENYSRKGIALRSFRKKFALSEYAVVQKAEYKDGMLRIFIATVLPEAKKPKKIFIES